MTTAPQNARIGEVVESDTSHFSAQCYHLYEAPPLGTIVRTHFTSGDSTLPENSYAVVYSVSTKSLDPGRPIIARGQLEENEEDVYRSNPQLSRLLATRFEALLVGYSCTTVINYSPSPLPPRIYAFVYQCAPDEIRTFTSTFDFVHLLATSGLPTADEAIVACLRQASIHHNDPHTFLVTAGRVLAAELSGELPRLNAIVRRLSP